MRNMKLCPTCQVIQISVKPGNSPEIENLPPPNGRLADTRAASLPAEHVLFEGKLFLNPLAQKNNHAFIADILKIKKD